MKWFFLALLALAGASVNLVFVVADYVFKIPGLIAVNLAVIGPARISHTCYFESNVIDVKGKDLGFALLCLSVGAFIMLYGVGAVLSGSCESFMSGRRYRLKNDVIQFIESLGYCQALGYIVAAVGVYITFAGTRLFFRVTRRAYW